MIFKCKPPHPHHPGTISSGVSSGVSVGSLGRGVGSRRPPSIPSQLIVGSGSSYHNMMGFFGRMPNVTVASAAFDAYITAAVNADDDVPPPSNSL